jgi:para-nitrobenzyl esterase
MTEPIQIQGGTIRGSEVADGVLGWRGIPYAAAPVASLRWQLPQPPLSWSGVRDATEYGAPSLQPPGLQGVDTLFGGASPAPLPDPSEDCLYLNVTAPAQASKAPVIVWIHGGGYDYGNGLDHVGDGSAFARDYGAVVVSFNYRLGALGFLSLDGEDHTGAYGLHDQIAALRWVHDNIAAFGGDPDRVTIYGISAGAFSVANIIASPLASGLFAQAASSSGAANHVADAAQTQALARRFLKELGFLQDPGAHGGQLRDIPAQDVLQAQSAIGEGARSMFVWRPAVDGLALTQRPIDAISAGAAKGVPLLAQHCVNECATFQFAAPESAAQTDRVLEQAFGPDGRDEIFAAYIAAVPGQDPTDLRVDIMSACNFIIPTGFLADAHSAHGPVWRSRFDGPITGLPKQIVPTGQVAAFHGSDATRIWTGGDGVGGELHSAWGSFVTTGQPAAPSGQTWPPYTPEHRPTMIFSSAQTRVEDDPDAARRSAWDGRSWQPGTWYQFVGIS